MLYPYCTGSSQTQRVHKKHPHGTKFEPRKRLTGGVAGTTCQDCVGFLETDTGIGDLVFFLFFFFFFPGPPLPLGKGRPPPPPPQDMVTELEGLSLSQSTGQVKRGEVLAILRVKCSRAIPPAELLRNAIYAGMSQWQGSLQRRFACSAAMLSCT